jgi:hypothetical protein
VFELAAITHNGPIITLWRRWVARGSEETMLERLVSIVVGGIVTFLLLLLFDDGRIVGEEMTGYLLAVVIGALIALFWPFMWGTYTTRRQRARYDANVRAEVQRQVEAQRVVPEEPEAPV